MSTFDFTSQICTTRSQSERLLALGLKKETADLMWSGLSEVPICHPYNRIKRLASDLDDKVHPAWSLHRLIEMIPAVIPDASGITHFFTIEGTSDISYYYFGEESWEIWKSWNKKELYDNIIDCIQWLIKEGYFNKEYLE